MELQSIVIDDSEEAVEEQLKTREKKRRSSVAQLPHIRTAYSTISSHFLSRINRRLEETRRRNVAGNWSPSVSIFRLPPGLTQINHKSTQPEIVSIGPYHRGKVHLLEFEEHKWFFLDKFLRRNEKDLTDHLLEMEVLEARTRKCYSENIPMSSEDFIEMMLLDGCFLIEVLCHLGRDQDDSNSDADSEIYTDIDDPVFSRPWLIPILVRDLVKLENQIPMFLLKSLFSKSNCSEETFIKLILEFFSLSWSGPTLTYQPEFLKCSHLLNLFYSSLLPSFSVNSTDHKREIYSPSKHSMQCVTQLWRSGIKFKPREAESFLYIKYEKKVLQIPSITINDTTSTVLLNCVALEQCQDYNIKFFSNYVSFMYCLINQARDVAFLGQDGIITKFSQDDQYVADFFKDLGENTVLNIRESYLSKVFQHVDVYYSSLWASMMRKYFSSRWSFISVFSAFVLLMLTMVQTIISVLSYKP